MTKQQTIELLEKQLPCFYSIEQVIKLITDIDEGSEGLNLDSDFISNLSSEISDSLESEGDGLVNDYDLSVNGREIEIDSIYFDTSKIERIVSQAVKEHIDNLKG